MLIEIAPGVDLNKDIFDKMEFRPSVSAQLKLMDMHLFQDKKMEIQQRT